MSISTKSFAGGYLLFRRAKGATKKNGRIALKRKFAGNPTMRHETREAAEAEAARLLALFPDSTFLILQEVGICKAELAVAEALAA